MGKKEVVIHETKAVREREHAQARAAFEDHHARMADPTLSDAVIERLWATDNPFVRYWVCVAKEEAHQKRKD